MREICEEKEFIRDIKKRRVRGDVKKVVVLGGKDHKIEDYPRPLSVLGLW